MTRLTAAKKIAEKLRGNVKKLKDEYSKKTQTSLKIL
jgi:hypothetical protein